MPTTTYPEKSLNNVETGCHAGVMWGAIFCGALATAIVVVLLSLLAGAFGFASFSPWGNVDADTGKKFVISTAIVLIVVQWLSSAFGGYLTGRMRASYIGAHTHEVFFRDTAHGFLAWSLATLAGFLLLAPIVMHAHQSGGMGRMHSGPEQSRPSPMMTHNLNKLYAGMPEDAALADHDRDEVTYIMGQAATGMGITEDEIIMLQSSITHRAKVSSEEAKHRVDAMISDVKTVTDSMRKYAAVSSLFLFFSMVIGAFIASAAAGLGGIHRDCHFATGNLRE